MEYNPAYGWSAQPNVNSDFISPEYVQNKCYQAPASVKDKPSKETDRRELIMNILGTIVITAMIVALVLIVLAVIILVVLYGPTSQVQSEADSENLSEMLNQTNTSQPDHLFTTNLQETSTTTEPSTTSGPPTTAEPPTTTEPPPPIGSFENPASSCSDISQNSPSGEYWIQNNNSPVQVYCDMTRTCCNTTGGWTRVTNLDMTDPSQQCPDGLRLVNRTTAPLRTCDRPDNFIGCVSTTFPVHGTEYSHVCGRVIGYQYGSTDAFGTYSQNGNSINDAYVDGVSLTYGQSPRQHIWTFANAVDEVEISGDRYSCPCIQPEDPFTGTVPPFVGQDYFCATGSRDYRRQILYADDPLWDGQGCGGNSTCCSFNNPPWFCKDLPQPTTDDIELRICGDEYTYNEDTALEIMEMYIK